MPSPHSRSHRTAVTYVRTYAHDPERAVAGLALLLERAAARIARQQEAAGAEISPAAKEASDEAASPTPLPRA